MCGTVKISKLGLYNTLCCKFSRADQSDGQSPRNVCADQRSS